MVFRKLFGQGEEDEPQERSPERVTIRVEMDGQTYSQTYPDMETAQLRFPQYLADLAAIRSRNADS